MAAKLGFTVESDIISWAKDHHNKIHKEVSSGFSQRKLTDATKADPNKTKDLIDAMDLWSVVSIPGVLLEYIRGGLKVNNPSLK